MTVLLLRRGLRRGAPVGVGNQQALELELRLLEAPRDAERYDRRVHVRELTDDLDDAVGGLVVEYAAPGLPVGATRQHHAHFGLSVGLLRRQLQRRPADP